jgi:hypothetical protein
VLSTDQKGAIAETAIIHEATKLGVSVAKPILPVPYDLIFDLGTWYACSANGRVVKGRSSSSAAADRVEAERA